jgi:DNA-binding response OmpR family regulator
MHDPAIARRMAALADRVDELQEENRQLRALLNPPATLPTHWRLTPLECRVVAAIARGRGRTVSTEQLLGTVYGAGHERDRSSLHVAIVKIRRKRDLHGLTISTAHGSGFSMSAECCAVVRAALAGEERTPEKMGGGMRGSPPIGTMAATA